MSTELMDQIRKQRLTDEDKSEFLKNPKTRDMMVALERLMELSNKLVEQNSSMDQPVDILELAMEESRRKASNKSKDEVTTIYFLGSKGGGKTTLINVFLDKKEPSGGTLALDFSFARRVNTVMDKEVCHFWELGGDAREWPNLIQIPILGCHVLNRLTAFIVLDLSQPLTMWTILEKSLSGIQSGFKEAIRKMDKSSGLNVSQDLEEKMRRRYENTVEEDRQFLKPFHIPVVIVGSKYDLFQNLEPETVKIASRILRLTAHIIGATLVFYTREDYQLKRPFRELVSHYAFNTKFPKTPCYEYGKCLLIPGGTDKLDQIWPGQKPSHYTLDFCKEYYEAKIGKDPDKGKPRKKMSNPADDERFAEPVIDQLRARKLEEILYRKK